MFKSYRKFHPLYKIIAGIIIDLPRPSNLSIWWNLGSLLGICLVVQVITGLFLSIHYTPEINIAFRSVIHIIRDVNYGWALRSLHANGSSLFFFCIYLHIGRRIYYGNYKNFHVWNSGVILFILLIATGFIGYVLPWGQIRFWGATVITNLFSAVPYLGKILVEWLWGGFAVDNATLNRFFIFHFILPFVIILFGVIHIIYLHESGSRNPTGLQSDYSKYPFHTYYSYKDITGIFVFILLLILISILEPNLLTDPDNYIFANPLVTPIHIKPEWYFLWAYAILRSIPNKLGGVVCIARAILILFIIPFINRTYITGLIYYPLNQFLFWLIVCNIILLTWIGGSPVEIPYEILGRCFTFIYFIYYILNFLLRKLWDNKIL